jgi:hypothetical protein
MELEKEDNSSGSISDNDVTGSPLNRTKTTIAFSHDDKDLPYNWSVVRSSFPLTLHENKI